MIVVVMMIVRAVIMLVSVGLARHRALPSYLTVVTPEGSGLSIAYSHMGRL
jgi:hypothetical protein